MKFRYPLWSPVGLMVLASNIWFMYFVMSCIRSLQ